MATQISSLTTLANNANSYDCLLPLVDPTLALNSRNVKVRISTHDQLFSNNFAVASLGTYGNYFGTGTDGSVTISSSAQISSSTSPGGLNNIIQFGDPVVKNFQNLTINSGVLFSPLRACRGMVIYCTGNLTVNGTISMTGKGGGVVTKIAAPIGIASSTDSRYDLVDATLYFNNFSSSTAGGYGIPTHWNWAPSGSAWFNNYKIRIPLSGSVAGGGAGTVGSAGIFCCGGGGGGSTGGGGPSGAGGGGGRGTIFTGGGGGGGAGGNSNSGAGSIGVYESGGNGGGNGPGPTGVGGGGGAGNPAGSASPGGFGNSGGIGVGGLLILIVRGSVTINGAISNNGVIGGAAAGNGGGGGGSGGGRIIIIYGGTYTNAGTVVANGGSGASPAGAAGGAGAITVRRVHV